MKFVRPIKLLMAATAVSVGSFAVAAGPAFASTLRLGSGFAGTPRLKPGPPINPSIIYADGGPAHVYVDGRGFPPDGNVTLTVLTVCTVRGIPDVCDDIGRQTIQADPSGNFHFLFHATGNSSWAPNLGSYTGNVEVAADWPHITQDGGGTVWSETTINPPPQFFDTYQQSCSVVETSASGWEPSDSVRFDLWAPGGNLLGSTTTTADPNSTVAQASLPTDGYSGVAWVAADEMGNPSSGPPAPDAEIWYQLNLC